jgi:putative membrane protein
VTTAYYLAVDGEGQGSADPDSRARTHLANERTFLAWFRTGLTLIAFGLIGGQFLSREVAGGLVRLLSTIAVGTGVFLVLVGAQRYASGRALIDAASFRPAALSILVATGAAVIAGALAILFLWLLPVG